jgi:ATP/ADP translocase
MAAKTLGTVSPTGASPISGSESRRGNRTEITRESAETVAELTWGRALEVTGPSRSGSWAASRGREALYVPTRKDEQYKAKAFIDLFVQRTAKALAVGVSLGITLTFQDFSRVRGLGAFTLPGIALWILAARYAGRRVAARPGACS